MSNKIRKKIITNAASGNGGGSGGSSSATEITMNITGSNTIDLTGYSGELLINLTSGNATETIYYITNFTNVRKVTLRPAVGLTLNIIDANSVGLGGGYNIYLNAPAKQPKGDYYGFIELTKRNTNQFYETNFIDMYNPAM